MAAHPRARYSCLLPARPAVLMASRGRCIHRATPRLPRDADGVDL